MRLAERAFHLGGRPASSEDEAQIARTFRQRNQNLIRLGRHLHVFDALDRARLLDA